MAKNAKLYVDDTGARLAGSLTEVTAAIGSQAVSSWATIVAPHCRGDTWETEEGEVIQASIPATIKFVKSDPLLARLKAAHAAGSVQNVQCSTGDSGDAGHELLDLDALVKQFNITKDQGSVCIVDVVFVPHTDGAAPLLVTTTAP